MDGLPPVGFVSPKMSLSPSLPPVEMPPPSVCITSGLSRSDKVCDDVPITKVKEYLASRKECYERTQPTEREPKRILNRVYVDIDGELDTNISEAEFNKIANAITAKLIYSYDGIGYALKESCKWKCADDKGKVSNKLSFTLHLKGKAGSKKAIAHYVKSHIWPELQKELDGIIDIVTVVKKANGKDYTGFLIIDLSVYNDGNRKMRMAGQSKPCQDRPYKIVMGVLEDTLITYIPAGCKILPEPQSILKLAEVLEEKEKDDTADPKDESVIYTEYADPTEDDLKNKDLIADVLDAIGKHHWDYYPDWLRIGFVMLNEGFTVEDFTDFSIKSKHFVKETSPAWIKSKWRMFRKSNLTQSILWKWLSEDDMGKYLELSKARMDFWNLIRTASHAETARFFYNLRADAYLYNQSLGWFQLQGNNIWRLYEKHPSSMIADIHQTFQRIGKEHQSQIDMTETNEDKIKLSRTKLKGIYGFFAKVGNKSFCDGVIAFVQNCYTEDDLHKKMDEQRHLFAFNDTVYDLDKHEARPVAPDDFICLNTGYAYPRKRFPEARKELIDTLRSVFELDGETAPDELGALTSYVLKTLALCLHGRKKYEKFFVWTGSGGNGKGMIAEIVKRVLGDYFHTVPHQVITKSQDKKDATCPPLAKAKGKRCVMASEPEANDKLQVGAIKEWTGGDEVSARDLYRSTVTFVPQFVLYLQTNTIPRLNRPDGGIERRLEVVEFPNKFVEMPTEPHHKKINIDLKDKIVKSPEWRDEMWWLLIEAYRLLETDGLKIPQCVLEKSKDYMASQNPIKEWLEANYTLGLPREDRRFFIETSHLRDHFINTTRNEISAELFKASMEALGQAQKVEKHNFQALRYVSEKSGDEWIGGWRDAEGRAGRFWMGIKKAKAPMPPETEWSGR